MSDRTLRVGELAKRTGLSVRTLHYYEEVGLLGPIRRRNGQRAYSVEDVARLHQIRALRDLGFSIEVIRRCFEDAHHSPLEIVELHLAQTRQRIEAETALCSRLEAIADSLRAGREVAIDEFVTTIEVMTMKEQYFSAEQREALKARAEQLGPDRIEATQNEWPKLIAQVRAAMDDGVAPDDPAVLALAARWRELVGEFTGGDPGITESLATMYREQPQAGASFGLDPEIFAYIGRAQAALATETAPRPSS